MAAAYDSHVDVVMLLLEEGADVNAGGGSAIIAAIAKGHVEFAGILEKEGVEFSIAEEDEPTNYSLNN